MEADGESITSMRTSGRPVLAGHRGSSANRSGELQVDPLSAGPAPGTRWNALSYHWFMVERDAFRHVPPGWPDGVSPPGTDEWETTAAAA